MKTEVTMYTVECDNCGKQFEDEYNGYSCWCDFNDAWESASEVNWVQEDNDVHYCPDCYSFDDNDEIVLKVINNQ